jgi:hypothetical protein
MCCGNCANGACQPGACASSCARVPSYDSMCVSIYGSNTYVYYFQCNGTCGSQGPALGLLSTGHCTTGAIGAGRTNSLPAGGWCAACDQQC